MLVIIGNILGLLVAVTLLYLTVRLGSKAPQACEHYDPWRCDLDMVGDPVNPSDCAICGYGKDRHKS